MKFIEKILKKFLEKDIYYKEYTSNTHFNINAQSYVKIQRRFSFKSGICYVIDIPNIAYVGKNKSKTLLRALEHESIGMAKYNICKELLVKKEIKNFHY